MRVVSESLNQPAYHVVDEEKQKAYDTQVNFGKEPIPFAKFKVLVKWVVFNTT